MQSVHLVVPTNRDVSKFLDVWLGMGIWDAVHVVEDRPESECTSTDERVCLHNWKSIAQALGSEDWIISHKDGGIRSFGILQAHRMGAEITVLLDDDCFPSSNWEIRHHIDVLTEGVSAWVNPLAIHLRGTPYRNCGKVVPVINMGMWENVPDIDSITQLSVGIPKEYTLPIETRIVSRGQYFPVSGMNVAFSSYVSPLMYQPVMGRDQPYRRFDDIWGGVVAKKICDHLGLLMSYGPPHILHNRASDPFTNLDKESPGIFPNEYFWEVIDGFKFTANSPTECILELSQYMRSNDPPRGMDANYWKRLGNAYAIWGGLFL